MAVVKMSSSISNHKCSKNWQRSYKRWKVGLCLFAMLTAPCFAVCGCGCESSADRRAKAPKPITVREFAQDREEEVDSAESEGNLENPYADGGSLLTEYYLYKYSDKERDAVENGVAEMLSHYSQQDINEAADEILNFHHVIFHKTKRHNMLRNYAVVDEVKHMLSDFCQLYGVPLAPMSAIISWENSGDVDEVSWANAAGLGQMTPGAVERAHLYAKQLSNRLKLKASKLKKKGQKEEAQELEEKAAKMDCAPRHKKLAASQNVTDERLIVENNLEDTVIFFKYLLEKYDDRADLAISAYHNGLANNDDVLYYYFSNAKQDPMSRDSDDERAALERAIKRNDVKYVDLWNHVPTREILAGHRTIHGNMRTEENANLCLGDESDIYPWKVLGSWIGYEQGSGYTSALIQKYSQRWDLCEVEGLPTYETSEDLENAKKENMLVPFAVEVKNVGIDHNIIKKNDKELTKLTSAESKGLPVPKKAKNAKEEPIADISPEVKNASRLVTPELAGYLADLSQRFKTALGNKKALLPIGSLSGAWAIGSAKDPCIDKCAATHKRGVAVDIILTAIPTNQRKVLNNLLRRDFLMDIVYMTRTQDGLHLVLNPRQGEDFMDDYVKYVNPKGMEGKPGAQKEKLSDKDDIDSDNDKVKKSKSSSKKKTKKKKTRKIRNEEDYMLPDDGEEEGKTSAFKPKGSYVKKKDSSGQNKSQSNNSSQFEENLPQLPQAKESKKYEDDFSGDIIREDTYDLPTEDEEMTHSDSFDDQGVVDF